MSLSVSAAKETSYLKSSCSPHGSPRELSDVSEDNVHDRVHKVTTSRREQHLERSKEKSGTTTPDKSELSTSSLFGSPTASPMPSGTPLLPGSAAAKPTESGEFDLGPASIKTKTTSSRMLQGETRSKSSKSSSTSKLKDKDKDKEKSNEAQEVIKLRQELLAANERMKVFEMEQLNLQLQLKELTEQNVRLMNQIYTTRQRYEFGSSETLSSSGAEKSRLLSSGTHLGRSPRPRGEGSFSYSAATPDHSGTYDNSMESQSGSARSDYSNRSEETTSTQQQHTRSELGFMGTSSTSEREMSGSLSPTSSAAAHGRKPKKSLPLSSSLASPFRKEKGMLLTPPRASGSRKSLDNSGKEKRGLRRSQEDFFGISNMDSAVTISFNTKHTIRSVQEMIDYNFGKEIVIPSFTKETSFVPVYKDVSILDLPPLYSGSEPIPKSSSSANLGAKSEKAADKIFFGEEIVFTGMMSVINNSNHSLYNKIFKAINHMILLCKTELHSSILCLTPTNPTRALFLTHVNYRYFTFPLESKDFKPDSIKKYIQGLNLFRVPVSICIHPCANYSLMNAILSFEKNNSYGISPLHLGVIWQQAGQSIMQALGNVAKEATTAFTTFTSSLGCENFDESEVFNDVFQDIKIKWFLGTSMEADMVRRYIGNSPIIIIFQDMVCTFSVDAILELGKVNQFFFIVQQVPGGLYRIGILHKLATYKAEIPLNYLFDKTELRDFILISACNAMAALKEDSLISQLYSIPRQIAIETMCSDYRKNAK